MKTYLPFLIVLCICVENRAFAQHCGCSRENNICICNDINETRLKAQKIKDTTCKEIENEISRIKTSIKNANDLIKKGKKPASTGKLVSNYTFIKRIKRDYAKILNVENAFANLNTYADVSVDEDKSTFSFSPIVIRNSYSNYIPFWFYGSMEFKGSVDDDQIFKVFDKTGLNRDVKCNINLNFIPNRWNTSSFAGHLNCPRYTEMLQCAKDKICSDYDEILIQLTDKDTCKKLNALTENAEELCDGEKLRDAIWEKYSKVEEKLSAPFWRWNKKFWISVALTPYGYKEYNAIDTTIKKIENKNYYNPSGKIAVNYLWNNVHNSKAVYANAWVEIAHKTSFDESKTATYYHREFKIDSISNILETKDVYLYNKNTYTEKYLANAGFQLIGITELCFHNSQLIIPIGLDITYRLEYLPGNSYGLINYQKHLATVGVLLPLNDKDGERKVNIELFRGFNYYSISEIEGNEYWGVKFSAPLFSKM